MPSVLTANDGNVIALTPQERAAPWVFVPDSEYIGVGVAPDGYAQTRYLLSESSLTFDAATNEMGAVHTPIAAIDAPAKIPNDGSTHDVTFRLVPDEVVDVEVSVSDYTDTATLNPAHTEQVSSTATAGTLIDVTVRADGIVDATASIEVVQA